jgi:hypothetical protein
VKEVLHKETTATKRNIYIYIYIYIYISLTSRFLCFLLDAVCGLPVASCNEFYFLCHATNVSLFAVSVSYENVCNQTFYAYRIPCDASLMNGDDYRMSKFMDYTLHIVSPYCSEAFVTYVIIVAQFRNG